MLALSRNFHGPRFVRAPWRCSLDYPSSSSPGSSRCQRAPVHFPSLPSDGKCDVKCKCRYRNALSASSHTSHTSHAFCQ